MVYFFLAGYFILCYGYIDTKNPGIDQYQGSGEKHIQRLKGKDFSI